MTADPGSVRFERRGSTAIITLDRPSARNALTWSMYRALDRALDRAASENDLRVLVIRGAGGNFAAGTDISQFVEFKSAEDGVEYERRLDSVVGKLESVPVATIAAVEGFALGGGLALAAACDVRIATPNACFGIPVARTVGNCLSMANYARLVASFGASRTMAMLFTSDFMLAHEAHALGFVSAVVEGNAFDTEVDTLAGRLASHAPITLQVTREAVRRIVARSVADGDDLVRRVYGSRDFHEGVSAFLEKRKPEWEGR